MGMGRGLGGLRRAASSAAIVGCLILGGCTTDDSATVQPEASGPTSGEAAVETEPSEGDATAEASPAGSAGDGDRDEVFVVVEPVGDPGVRLHESDLAPPSIESWDAAEAGRWDELIVAVDADRRTVVVLTPEGRPVGRVGFAEGSIVLRRLAAPDRVLLEVESGVGERWVLDTGTGAIVGAVTPPPIWTYDVGVDVAAVSSQRDEPTLVTDAVRLEIQEVPYPPSAAPAISPDGRFVTTVAGTADQGLEVTVYDREVRQGTVTVIVDPGWSVGRPFHRAFSPSSTTLVLPVHAERESGEVSALAFIDVVDGRLVAATVSDLRFARWLDDAQFLGNDGDRWGVYELREPEPVLVTDLGVATDDDIYGAPTSGPWIPFLQGQEALLVHRETGEQREFVWDFDALAVLERQLIDEPPSRIWMRPTGIGVDRMDVIVIDTAAGTVHDFSGDALDLPPWGGDAFLLTPTLHPSGDDFLLYGPPSERQLWRLAADGTAMLVTTDGGFVGGPIASPNGRLTLFGDGAFTVLDPESGERIELPGRPSSLIWIRSATTLG